MKPHSRRWGSPTGFRMQLLEDWEHLLPGLSSTCCIFDGGLHTGTIAFMAPKGTQKENRKGQAK